MEITEDVKNILLTATAKALATSFDDDINVVPVSSIRIEDEKIWLIDYFFNKTRENVKKNSKVALTCWSGLKGYQIKAKVLYLDDGESFRKAKKWIANIHPNRIVKGLLILNVIDVFDISIDNKVL